MARMLKTSSMSTAVRMQLQGAKLRGTWTFDIAMKGCVVIVVARSQSEEVFTRFGRAVAKELDFDIAQRRVQGDRHATAGGKQRGIQSMPAARCAKPPARRHKHLTLRAQTELERSLRKKNPKTLGVKGVRLGELHEEKGPDPCSTHHCRQDKVYPV